MKKIIFFLFGVVVLTAVSSTMTSCLQYDEPGDEFELGQLKPGDSSVTAKPAPVFEADDDYQWYK